MILSSHAVKITLEINKERGWHLLMIQYYHTLNIMCGSLIFFLFISKLQNTTLLSFISTYQTLITLDNIGHILNLII